MVEDGHPAQEPLQVQGNDAAGPVKTLKDDIAAVLRHSGAHPGFDQFLDLLHHVAVFVIIGFFRFPALPSNSGNPWVKCSITAPRMAGFKCFQRPRAWSPK